MIPDCVLLEGAPDALIGTPAAKSKAVQVMHLEMNNDILDELLECIRKGKAPQVLFGKTPSIRYEGKSHVLHSSTEKFRHELYRENDENKWGFSGLINHSLAIRDVEEASAGADMAMETLKNNMAAIEQEREARKLTISTPEMRSTKGLSKAQSRATILKPLLANNARGTPASPAFGASTPSHLAAPPSAGLDMPHDIAIRKSLVHLLAVEPKTYDKCRFAVHTNPRRMLEKIARQTRKDDEWALQDRAYKELDVFNFRYKEEDRQSAIENAIRAFDRMRLDKSDPLWQKLLPKEERGKGKILSRLHMNMKEPANLNRTPALKAKSFDKKTGLPKKTESKKADKEGTKAKEAKEAGRAEKSKAPTSPAEVRTPKLEPRREKQPAKRSEARKALDESRTPDRKQVKPSTAAKGMLNMPKNRSPLASPPVNASDYAESHPIHKALSAATSPRRAAKRKADEINGNTHHANGINKRPHIESSGSSSEERPLKATSTNGMTNGHHSSDDDSSGSPPLALSWRQSVEMARKFNTYYQKYKKLYTELSQSPDPPSEAKRDELLAMHARLEKMKRDVGNGAL